MDTLKVATLIEALTLVGRVYRSKDGSQPAEPVKKIIAQLQGTENLTLTEWAEAKQAKAKNGSRKRSKPKVEAVNLGDVVQELQRVRTQAALRDAIARLALSAGEWKELAKRLTGRSAKSGKAARETVETCLSDRLLLDERVESVKRQFMPAIQRPGAA